MSQATDVVLLFLPALFLAVGMIVVQLAGDIRVLRHGKKRGRPKKILVGTNIGSGLTASRTVLQLYLRRGFPAFSDRTFLVLRFLMFTWIIAWAALYGSRLFMPLIATFLLLLIVGFFAQIDLRRFSFADRLCIILLVPLAAVSAWVRK